jgi:hypothetical protein
VVNPDSLSTSALGWRRSSACWHKAKQARLARCPHHLAMELIKEPHRYIALCSAGARQAMADPGRIGGNCRRA